VIGDAVDRFVNPLGECDRVRMVVLVVRGGVEGEEGEILAIATVYHQFAEAERRAVALPSGGELRKWEWEIISPMGLMEVWSSRRMEIVLTAGLGCESVRKTHFYMIWSSPEMPEVRLEDRRGCGLRHLTKAARRV
jgi:hypothetical protein